MPTAGRRRGELMGIGRLLALDSEPAHWCLYPLARVARGRRGPRWIFLRNAPAALAACRAKGPSPTAGRSRCVVMVAQCIESASETAPALRVATFAPSRLACAFALPTRARGGVAAVLFCESGWRRTLEQRGATGSMPTAGRRRGELMGIGGLLALDSEPAHWCLYPLARVARGRRGPRWIFLRNAPAALAACRAKGPSPTAGRSRCVVMVASALESASETAPALRGRPSRLATRLHGFALPTRARGGVAAVLFCKSGWRRTLEQRAATGSMRRLAAAAAS